MSKDELLEKVLSAAAPVLVNTLDGGTSPELIGDEAGRALSAMLDRVLAAHPLENMSETERAACAQRATINAQHQ